MQVGVGLGGFPVVPWRPWLPDGPNGESEGSVLEPHCLSLAPGGSRPQRGGRGREATQGAWTELLPASFSGWETEAPKDRSGKTQRSLARPALPLLGQQP